MELRYVDVPTGEPMSWIGTMTPGTELFDLPRAAACLATKRSSKAACLRAGETRTVATDLAARGGGAVTLILRITGVPGYETSSTYALTKGAGARLARSVAIPWGPRNVRVNAISPGSSRQSIPGRG